ncbi:hypothetical protein LTS07_011157 [Exophiala sideris]|nr:hypothetical protein LTS07_011157 [Exophiala sideris]
MTAPDVDTNESITKNQYHAAHDMVRVELNVASDLSIADTNEGNPISEKQAPTELHAIVEFSQPQASLHDSHSSSPGAMQVIQPIKEHCNAPYQDEILTHPVSCQEAVDVRGAEIIRSPITGICDTNGDEEPRQLNSSLSRGSATSTRGILMRNVECSAEGPESDCDDIDAILKNLGQRETPPGSIIGGLGIAAEESKDSNEGNLYSRLGRMSEEGEVRSVEETTTSGPMGYDAGWQDNGETVVVAAVGEDEEEGEEQQQEEEGEEEHETGDEEEEQEEEGEEEEGEEGGVEASQQSQATVTSCRRSKR